MNCFYLAAGYYPRSHDKADVIRDLDNMKKAGINIVRTGEICCAWDQNEPVKGAYDFTWLDEFFDLCEERDMRILLGTGTASPPYWLRAEYPDVSIVSISGKSYPNNASYSWACFDHPGFRREAERYISALVKRYMGREGLFGYQIHNEVGFPFMPLNGGEMEIYCCCPHSVNAFRRWLQNKYRDIDELNRAYCWNATNVKYISFEQVEPPGAMPVAWASVTRWIDWRLFWMENTADFVAWQNGVIKRYDRVHPTTTNTFFMKSQDPFGVRMGIDQLAIAKSVDFFGIDIYPGSGNKAELKPEFSSMCLDMGRTAAQYTGRELAVLETESGPINGWVMGPDRNVKSADIWRNVFDAYGHGAMLALFQGYRDWDYQPIQWGGLTDLDGNPTERYHAVEKISVMLRKTADIARSLRPRKPLAAIVLSKENAVVMQGIGQEEFLLDAYRGMYTALWEKGIQVDVINTDMFSRELLTGYRLLCLPLLAALSEEDAKLIADFVSEGGCILAGARTGMLDRRGWRNHSIPCRPLDRVFGVSCTEAEAGVEPVLLYKDREYPGYWHKELLRTEDSAAVEAAFSDGTPAAVCGTYGKGHAFYVATHADMALIRKGSAFLPDYLDRVLECAGVRSECFCADIGPGRALDCHILDAEGCSLIIVTCRAGSLWPGGETCIRFAPDFRPSKAVDVFYDREVSFCDVGGGLYEINAEIQKNRANFFAVYRQREICFPEDMNYEA